jgi:geranylgeranyl transferase type-2 subunit alpha
MHGRKRILAPDSEEVRLARAEKERRRVVEYRDRYQTFSECAVRFRDKKTVETGRALLDSSAAVLHWNPELYTAWNARKECLLWARDTSHAETEVKEVKEDVKEVAQEAISWNLAIELELTQSAIQMNPKSYWAWYHRRWILVHIATCTLKEWTRELALCNKLLDLDSRNFHCWDYRRFVVERLHELQAEQSAVDELAYTTHKIHQNFSNYSAWHLRSKLLFQQRENITKEEYQERLKEGMH